MFPILPVAMYGITSALGHNAQWLPENMIGMLPMHSELSRDSRHLCFFPSQKSVTCMLHLKHDSMLRKKGKGPCHVRCISNIQTAKAFGHEVDFGHKIRRKQLAVFASGGGSNFRAIHEAIVKEIICGSIAVLVTDKPDCGGAEYARANGIPVVLYPKAKSSPEALSSFDLLNSLRKFEVDFILLAGYLKLIPIELVQAYPRSILNIHPSLLPAFGGKGFYGMKVHKAVIESGARFSGPTVHFVDEHYDTGRILAQRVVPVLAGDTPQQLAARVLHEEHRVYVEAVAALCEEHIEWREDGVPIIRTRGGDPYEYI